MQNVLKITLLAIDYRFDRPIQYKYRISNDSTWSFTQAPTIQYGSVPSGEWVFQCSAQNEAGQWGPINSEFKFSVAKPYYLQWWFIVLVLAFTGGTVWLIVQWRYAQAAKQEKTTNELNVLKIKALSSQMNPHFIFNSLNSIQNFLVENDLRMSNKYLSKFARLMRLILNNSNETFVPLKDVISTLELYLELEQLRFNHKFDYKIDIDPKIEFDGTRIPSMLLQPFLENAILHGLLPLDNKGLVTLKLEKITDQQVKAIVMDNGVGREFHKGRLGKKHKSHGLRITKERLKVFESFLGNKFNLTIRDLKNEQGKPEGTHVELTLPCA
jgi:two-component sensor histidine kinase